MYARLASSAREVKCADSVGFTTDDLRLQYQRRQPCRFARGTISYFLSSAIVAPIPPWSEGAA
jgi:hypothetical protein